MKMAEKVNVQNQLASCLESQNGLFIYLLHLVNEGSMLQSYALARLL
jgi:hypothetical protein